MFRRALAATFATALLLAACSDDSGKSATPDSTASQDDADLLETVADDVLFDPAQAYFDADGNLTFDGAKALFSAALVPLPGVEPAPDGEVEELTDIFMVLQAHRDELTPEQQQVFDSVALAGEETEAGGSAAAGFGSRRRASTIPLTVKRKIADAAAAAENYYAGAMGRRLGFPIRTVVLPSHVAGIRMFNDTTLADAFYTSDASGPYCRIRVNYDKYEEGELEFVMSHEVFHCFKFRITGNEPVADWVMEGTAQWAAEERTSGNITLAADWSNRWATTPTRPISRRSYDAVGLYALASELNVPLYSYVDDLLRTPRIATVRDAVGERLDIEWALSYAGRESWGAKYALTAGSFTGAGARRQILRATVDGGPVTFPNLPGSPDSGAQVYALAADGDVLVINGTGHGGIHFDGADEAEFNGSFVGDFCLNPSGCTCPDGTSMGGAGREIVGRGSRSVFIAWGPQSDSFPNLEVQSIAQWCNAVAPTETTAEPVGGCFIGMWQATRMNIPPVNDLPPIVGGEGMTVEFRSDGTFIANYDTMVPVVAVIDEKAGIIFEFQFTGVVPGTWAVDENNRITGTGDISAMRVLGRITEPIQQEVMNTPIGDMAGSGSAAGVYQVADCSGNRLKITTVYGGGELSIELQRIG
ncbi:MAG TPA: hypothetical protein PLV13_01255 [Ilumatobacteraceae bacterium]|nr:hypothetical protein [Ilumatobacteraceae bacterium]